MRKTAILKVSEMAKLNKTQKNELVHKFINTGTSRDADMACIDTSVSFMKNIVENVSYICNEAH